VYKLVTIYKGVTSEKWRRSAEWYWWQSTLIFLKLVSDVIWYHDDQIIRNTDNVKIRIKDNKTTCTIKKATKEDEGNYVCKATSDIGLAVTKAKLRITGERFF